MGLCLETPIFKLLERNFKVTDEEIRGMWYDWFCKETSLVNKGRKLLSRLSAITPSPRIDDNTTYVWFKNNCPVVGNLYDDFRIADIKTGNVVYCVVPSEGYTRSKGESCVWGNAPDTGKFEELARGSWKDVKEFFQTRDNARILEIVQQTRRFNLIREAEYDNKIWESEKRYALRQQEIEVAITSREYREQLAHLIGEDIP